LKKADHIHRGIAKAIDFLLVAFIAYFNWVGVLIGALYIAISDGFFNGQSVGKRILGLSVQVNDMSKGPRPCTFRDSIIRNAQFSVVVILASIPIIGWFFFLPLGIVMALIESYFVYFDDQGIRIGDIFAASRVVDLDAKKQ
jgi:hypothetical protein